SVPRGAVEFHHVGFGYRPGTPLFRDLTLSIQPGEHVALVGASGSGKSTLSKLLLRLMDVDDGGILIDGQDIRAVTLSSLRRHISYVPQDPQLLHRTIAENICYGLDPEVDAVGRWRSELDYDLVHRVGRAAHVEEFVFALPDGYDTVVGERGLKLSGGHRPGHGQGLPHPGPGRGHLGAGL